MQWWASEIAEMGRQIEFIVNQGMEKGQIMPERNNENVKKWKERES